ncbi:ABC transporter ATP-binding protein [Desulfitobacterium chlororespirans]|uniref:Multidrug/hemolysin transport system ATP-binding protein n=1 Tax=Desulfitobacterium chlororespirans DSM 11544 TaxID=1121395 RepID=A0A1M7UQH1_9FIRM|nr:ATP-binding cassette domain-containing protein [Desulfitobacterium chlororespirans]SHN85127.1 multidrug/hemolysin transport system ATP-binding protein [Desulfitobacterium chlororespirans DSM 11544]
MDKIIEVVDLHKSYGHVQAVKGLNFYVEKGKLFAFLGPNGAGKSTTIDIICTFLKPDRGRVIMDGYELGKEDNKIRSVIGAVFQDGLLDPLLTVEENLRIRGGFYGLKKTTLADSIKSIAALTGVAEFLQRPYGNLSGGQRRRADIARALVNAPKILFLDEPTTGLDPQTRKNVWETIQKMQKEKDMTIFLTTHYMEEAAEADYVMVIDNGTIAAQGTPTELKQAYASDRLKLSYHDKEKLSTALQEMHIPYHQVADQIIIELSSTLEALPILAGCQAYLTGLEVSHGTMDDAFIKITGKEMRE